MIVQEPVQAAIWHCLNQYDYSDAIFLSERLYAEVKSDETLFLLATAYYRGGQKARAYNILEENYGNSTKCQFLFSTCAYELGKYAEAESALLESENYSSRSLDDVVSDFGDQAAFVLLLLGKIASRTERRSRAIDTWKKALKINPFLFSAFENLCDIGDKPSANNIFQINNVENMSACHGHCVSNVESVFITGDSSEKLEKLEASVVTPHHIVNINPNIKYNQKELFSPDESPLSSPLCLSGIKPIGMTRSRFSNLKTNYRLGQEITVPESPTFGQFFDCSSGEYNGTPNYNNISHSNQPPIVKKLLAQKQMDVDHLNSRYKDALHQNCKPVLSQSSNVPAAKTPPLPLVQQPSQNVRRSSRLFRFQSFFSSYSVKENNKSPTRAKFATPKSPSRKTKQRIAKNLGKNAGSNELNNMNKHNIEQEKSETVTSESKSEKGSMQNTSCLQQALTLQRQSAEGLMTLLRDIGQAYLDLSSYNCQSAVQGFLNLPINQMNTTWIYCQLGKAYFEMTEYESSVKYFQRAHEQDPHQLNYMDVYSTALWHLQKEVALSALAQDLVNIDRNHPVTWCVNGNCFSLHKEHDTAIKFFQRGVQVDPNFPYAYTLLGHEYISTEELDKALGCFRNAVRLNPMHYNAWFGIGTIYSKQEKYQLAEMNFARALSINPHSCVILCHIGIVQHALKQTEKALATFNRAIESNPKSPLCKFHRASIYFALGRHMEALKELEELKEIVPKESSVYYLIGKVHKKLGNTDLALQHFSWATDLDPKGASNQIKEAFDPAIGRNTVSAESPTSPTLDEYPSERQQGDNMNFEGLPDDSEDSTFE
ncbi:cell division cycle protein 27 isoform X2 [Rhynchophorus ferrugineus]|uniref:cell division cycle protein 27 isoform X2 n=1 Tax=Rhynchophorus ferrugineus TaxID=354439 RepID=UPI003FCE95F1